MDTVIAVFVRILEVIFAVGILGSSVVLILTLIEDAKSLMPGDKDKKESETHSSSRTKAQPQMHASDIA